MKNLLKRIHINQHVIRRNLKEADPAKREPAISVKSSRGNDRYYEVEIHGPSKVVESIDKPLSCGARVWIETRAEVTGRQ